MSLRQSDDRGIGGISTSSISSENSRTGQNRPPYEKTFRQIVEAIRNQLKQQQQLHFTVSLTGEESQFTRFNRAKVRQTGQVRDGQIKLTLIAAGEQNTARASSIAEETTQPESRTPEERTPEGRTPENDTPENRTAAMTLPFIGNFAVDWASIQPAIALLQAELPHLPVDPYVVLPTAHEGNPKTTQSREIRSGKLLSARALSSTLIEPVERLDFSGLYAGGLSYRAYADSAGKQHWFETPSFTLDYSLFGERNNQAVKGTLAGRQWKQGDYIDSITTAQNQLELSAQPIKQVPRGCYRTYLAPAAVADLMDTIAWGGGLGEACLRQGNSAFSRLESGEETLSEKFSLEENFQQVGLPRFNSNGEIAPERLSVIHQGRWITALINGRSAKEYGKVSNGANREEAMRAPSVAPGTIKESEVLAALGTGLYVSNLHYLNWSDLSAGRITGMTRYACFWVENGEIIAPIENLRFDDDLYRFLGDGLIDLSAQQTFIPAVGTYDQRSLGGMWMPGMLIEGFRYTL